MCSLLPVSRMPVLLPIIMVTDRTASCKTTQYGATLCDDGAHIILPQGAQLFELGHQYRRLFENYARDRGAEWLERFQDRLGWPRSNSLHLLTGFYKTCSWSIASFGMQTAANIHPVAVHCTLREVDERIIRDDSTWQPAGRFERKIGPVPDRQGQNNQTVFIRGITVTPNRPEPGQSEKQAGLLGVLSAPTQFLGSFLGSSSGATAIEAPKSNVIILLASTLNQWSIGLTTLFCDLATFPMVHSGSFFFYLKVHFPRVM